MGERNQADFVAMLGSMTAAFLYVLINSFGGLSLSREDPSSEAYGAFAVCTLVSLLAFLFVAVLLIQHLYFVCTGITGWESLCRERIHYLKEIHGDLNPFDEGVVINIRRVLEAREVPQVWTLEKALRTL